MMKRQTARKALLAAAFLLSPITLYYFSPVLSLQGATDGIIAGSVLVFAGLFLVSLFLGRAFCGWACPMGGAQELLLRARPRAVRRRRLRWIKFLIWGPWFMLLVYFLARAGGVRAVRPFFMTTAGISVADLHGVIILVSVTVLFGLPALILGRRAGCHTVCWIAPFMMAGRAIRNLFRWPSLRLQARPEACAACGACAEKCPMSIEVPKLVRSGTMETADCILCGSCADTCPKRAVRLVFGPGA